MSGMASFALKEQSKTSIMEMQTELKHTEAWFSIENCENINE
jgi:hypothetical protein